MSRVIKPHFENDNLKSTYGLRAEIVVENQKIRLLQKMVKELQLELESLTHPHNLTTDRGLDFYTEVSHFEMEMIKQALIVANGQQTKAAELLNVKKSTLNAMIKRYCIQFGQIAAVGPSTISESHKRFRLRMEKVSKT